MTKCSIRQILTASINAIVRSTGGGILLLVSACSSNDVPSTYEETTISIEKYDYAHIIYYGQSLSCGADTPGALTTTPVDGCYMIGSSVEDFTNSIEKLPLVNINKECPVVSTVNSFATLYRQTVKPSIEFFASSCGSGGVSISELLKGTGLYNARFLNHINRIKNYVSNEGKTVCCPVIVYLQGENDVNPEFTPKETYKALMLQLKNDMQADIMNKYGQTKKPIFCIYSVSNQFNSQKYATIPMAQIEFAEENQDVYLLNPYYAMPSYQRLHMSMNGYRWYGSLCAKAIFEILVKHRGYSSIVPTEYEIIDPHTIKIDFYVPAPPLVLDTETIAQSDNYGFHVIKDGVQIALTSVDVYNRNSIMIKTQKAIDSGTIEVYYAIAGNIGDGIGNLRDSDNSQSDYVYVDDTNERAVSNGDPIYYHPIQLFGKKYPLYNWCAPFYKKLS